MAIYEKIFAAVATVVLILLLVAIAYAAVALKVDLPSHREMIHVKPGENLASAVLETPPFNSPGVRKVGQNSYEVVVLAQAWNFLPPEIDVPVGAEVTFRVTSVDVTHGFFIPNTRVNTMVIPGQVSVVHYRFTRPGTYLLLCHEYCGLLHHTMAGKVVVK